MEGAARRWAELLDGWTIPDEILYSVVDSPWQLDPERFDPRRFDAPSSPLDTPSRTFAMEALPVDGTVLDVACGAGAAGLALVPPASRLVGVDSSAAMLARFVAACEERGVPAQAVEGVWPQIARRVHNADVVLCHHALYNMRDAIAAVVALTGHARRRVVVEIGALHPLVSLGPLWRHFWDLDRPSGPTAGDFLAVLDEAGIRPVVERSPRVHHHVATTEDEVAMVRRRLCLPPERDTEVAEQLRALPPAPDDVWSFAWPGDA
jgi:SAM-dependent methyltransferase